MPVADALAAASSTMARRSSGRAETICPIRPCSMMEYAVRPTPELTKGLERLLGPGSVRYLYAHS